MVIYFAEIAGVRAAVDPCHCVEVGVVVGGRPVEPGETPILDRCVQWIGRRTWREVAIDFEGQKLVTRSRGSIVSLACSLDDSLDYSDPLTLSADETRLILEVLVETGKGALAERIAPVLERCTRTDPPPAPPARMTPTEPQKKAKR